MGGRNGNGIWLKIDELARKLEEMKVSKDTTLITMCEHGGRSSRAAVVLQKLGQGSQEGIIL